MAGVQGASSSKGLRSTQNGSARNAPLPISNLNHLARSQLERFNLHDAMEECREDLSSQHRHRLTGSTKEPPRAEDLRKNPMAATPPAPRTGHQPRARSSGSSVAGNCLRVPENIAIVTTTGTQLLKQQFTVLPLHATNF
ncbi:unnamed protein product [Polarella glacialis]|uniref:Uncharacterized protein n=1 Tax=Polarella glacialis TaxID=89957 RepID=A0A813HP13_POLGL|nr:unnamed protein product [Polarella glacialis]